MQPPVACFSRIFLKHCACIQYPQLVGVLLIHYNSFHWSHLAIWNAGIFSSDQFPEMCRSLVSLQFEVSATIQETSPSTELNLRILKLTHLDVLALFGWCLLFLLCEAVFEKFSAEVHPIQRSAWVLNPELRRIFCEFASGGARTDRQISSAALTGVARYCPAWKGSGRRVGIWGWKINETKGGELRTNVCL